MLRNYRRFAQLVPVRKLAQQVARDPDDDAVLACALAAQANLIVSGDRHLLAIARFQDIPIVKPAEAVKIVSG
jgi:putative PIN family toxin of toxin-antitoxin system